MTLHTVLMDDFKVTKILQKLTLLFCKTVPVAA